MWRGQPTSILDPEPSTEDGKEVEEEWGFGRYDARTHSLYPSLRGHLEANEPLRLLDEAIVAIEAIDAGGSEEEARGHIQAFQDSLRPHDRIEKLIAETRCEICSS